MHDPLVTWKKKLPQLPDAFVLVETAPRDHLDVRVLHPGSGHYTENIRGEHN